MEEREESQCWAKEVILAWAAYSQINFMGKCGL